VNLFGLGGSAFGGEIIRNLIFTTSKVPFTIFRGYEVPAYLNANSLVIASSYSGNTEETLEAAELARKAGARIIVVTSGGKLKEWAGTHGFSVITLPGGYPPRAAAGLSFVQQRYLLRHYGLIPDFEADDKGRVYHTWEKWECFKAGFYAERIKDMTTEEGEEKYREFLSDVSAFESALAAVITQWKFSCEHYLTNDRMNRIAWLGQAATCIVLGIPAAHRGGFYLLTAEQQDRANAAALAALNKWLESNGREVVDMDTAAPDREMEIY
jgi:hypothetical protein